MSAALPSSPYYTAPPQPTTAYYSPAPPPQPPPAAAMYAMAAQPTYNNTITASPDSVPDIPLETYQPPVLPGAMAAGQGPTDSAIAAANSAAANAAYEAWDTLHKTRMIEQKEDIKCLQLAQPDQFYDHKIPICLQGKLTPTDFENRIMKPLEQVRRRPLWFHIIYAVVGLVFCLSGAGFFVLLFGSGKMNNDGIVSLIAILGVVAIISGIPLLLMHIGFLLVVHLRTKYLFRRLNYEFFDAGFRLVRTERPVAAPVSLPLKWVQIDFIHPPAV